MASPADREHTDISAQSPKEPLNWGWIALGGCLVIALLNPVSLMVIGMSIESIRQDRQSDRRDAQRNAQSTAVATALVCIEPLPGVLARIEAGLPSPNIRLRGARAVHSSQYPWLSVIAAEVEWRLGYEGERGLRRLAPQDGEPRLREPCPRRPDHLGHPRVGKGEHLPIPTSGRHVRRAGNQFVRSPR